MTTVYLKRTSAVTGLAVVTQHECWNVDRFMASQEDAESKLKQEGKDYCFVSRTSAADYRSRYWKGKK